MTDLANRNLTQIPTHMPQNLNWIVLDNNQISQIGEDKLPSGLINFSISGNLLTSIFATEIDRCRSSLRVLNLSQNRLLNIQAVGLCVQLKELNLSQNQITDNVLSATITNLRKLRKLDVSGNQLKNGFKLADTIHNLKGLKSLKVSDNQLLSQLRIDIGRHNRLRELHASSNKIQSLIIERQSQNRSESQLKVINVSDNQIDYFEGLILVSASLVELNMSQNNLEMVSFAEQSSNSLLGMMQLRQLNLSQNQLK